MIQTELQIQKVKPDFMFLSEDGLGQLVSLRNFTIPSSDKPR